MCFISPVSCWHFIHLSRHSDRLMGERQSLHHSQSILFALFMWFLAAENENRQLEDLPQADFGCVPERFLLSIRTNSITENFAYWKLRPKHFSILSAPTHFAIFIRRLLIRLFSFVINSTFLVSKGLSCFCNKQTDTWLLVEWMIKQKLDNSRAIFLITRICLQQNIITICANFYIKMMDNVILPLLPSSAFSVHEPCGSSPQWCKVKITQSVRLVEWPRILSKSLYCVRRENVLLGDSRVSSRSPLGQTSRLTRTWTCSKKRMFPHSGDFETCTVSSAVSFIWSLKKCI